MTPHHFRGNFQNHLKDILGEEMFSGVNEQSGTSGKYPKINLYESKDKIFIYLRIPGIKDPSQIQISLSGSSLLIKGRIDQLHRQEGIKLVLSECYEGEFERNIGLPAAICGIGTVNYRNGMFNIELIKEQRNDSVQVKVEFA